MTKLQEHIESQIESEKVGQKWTSSASSEGYD